MQSPIAHYSDVIGKSYQELRQLNKKYSMASFAKRLGLSPAQLSKILSKKQQLSHESAQRVGQRLFPGDPRNQELFLDLFRASTSSKAADIAVGQAAAASLEGKLSVKLEQTETKFVTNWYVIAVFDLLSLQNPPTSALEIAGKLGIDLEEALQAIRSLEAIELIEPKNGFYSKKVMSFRTTNNIPSREIQNLHRQFLGKAMQAIEQQPLEQRYFKAVTVSLNSGLLPELRGAVDRFLGEISRIEAISAGNSDRLYQLNVQLFDLIQNEREKKDEEIA